MDYKTQLGVMLDAFMAGKEDEAKVAFHQYAVARTSSLIAEGKKGVNPFAKKDEDEKKDKGDKDAEKKDKKEGKDSDKSDDDKDGKDKKGFVPGKKGVNPFAKKDDDKEGKEDKDGKKDKKDKKDDE